ncbi:MAG: 30S ribosomal protein S9 [Sumerlaeia bacterium]
MALEQYYGTGRRKTAVARVYLRPGKGRMVINGKDWKDYFGDRPALDFMMRAPLRETQSVSKMDILINVAGGGPIGQAGAIRHGIARAMLEVNPENRPLLKKLGFLTRDARKVERKKYGFKKARRSSQFSKR